MCFLQSKYLAKLFPNIGTRLDYVKMTLQKYNNIKFYLLTWSKNYILMFKKNLILFARESELKIRTNGFV